MKAGVTRIHGIDEVMGGINAHLKKMQFASMRGMLKAAAFIRQDMDKTEPKIPIDTGNLRSSWFITPVKNVKGDSGVIMGFSANYAVYVHEMVDADFTSPRTRYGPGPGRKRTYKPRPGAGAKFLEYAIKRNTHEIFRIIAEENKRL